MELEGEGQAQGEGKSLLKLKDPKSRGRRSKHPDNVSAYIADKMHEAMDGKLLPPHELSCCGEAPLQR